MNILFIITILFLIIMMIIGVKKGFVKIAYSLLSMTLSLLLVSFCAPHVQELLVEKTPIYEKVVEVCENKLESQLPQQGDATELKLYLPAAIEGVLNQMEEESAEQVDTAVQNVATSIANWLTYGISFILSFMIVTIALKWVGIVLDVVTKLPVLRGANKMLGLFAGLIQGVMILWIAALVLSMFCTTDTGQLILTMVNENSFLQFLYHYNGIIYLALLFL